MQKCKNIYIHLKEVHLRYVLDTLKVQNKTKAVYTGNKILLQKINVNYV